MSSQRGPAPGPSASPAASATGGQVAPARAEERYERRIGLIGRAAVHATALARRLGALADRACSRWWAVQLGSCGRHFHVTRSSVIEAPDHIRIGDDFLARGPVYLFANDGELVIGNGASLARNVEINASGGRIVIGDRVLIAPNVVLRAANHRTDLTDRPIADQGHVRGTIVVEDDVWIAANAVITPNVTLRRGTVVGAGAVVTRSTEPHTVVGGVPARCVARRSGSG
ncbi:MAG: acyltransferase [Acidimicrobiia bacterium]|nr:acyltransferase [Acidimicrobiia bacterium]